jgi:hypothetical protein
MLERVDPERAGMLLAKAQEDVDARWRLYEQLAGIERGPEQVAPDGGDPGIDEEEAESS